MGVGVRYPEASTAWRTFSLRPSLLNVILFPKTGCNLPGTSWNLSGSRCLGGRAFALQLKHPSTFTGLFARTNTSARTLDAATERFLTRTAESAPGDSGDGRFHYRLSRPNAMNFQASHARAQAKTTFPHAVNCRASCHI